MHQFRRNDLPSIKLPGRIIQNAVGKDSYSHSIEMTMGFAHYSVDSGPMEPHRHAEEVVYVLSVDNGWIRVGEEKKQLGPPILLETGMILHLPEFEWHVFEYGENGHVDIFFLYGRVDNIRPDNSL